MHTIHITLHNRLEQPVPLLYHVGKWLALTGVFIAFFAMMAIIVLTLWAFFGG